MARVLLVEDEFLIRQLAAEELAEAGHEVVEADCADAALPLLRGERPFDILFTDIRMPGALDGWGLGEEAKRALPGIGIIYSSGYSSEIRAMAERERMLPKPYRMTQMIGLIEEMLSTGRG